MASNAMESFQLEQPQLLGEEPAYDETGQVIEVDADLAVAQSMGLMARSMQGDQRTPAQFQPSHRLTEPKTMTKAQLEQKMREAQGYPSNSGESAKVVALEEKVGTLQVGIDLILDRLSPPSEKGYSPDPPPQTCTGQMIVEPPLRVVEPPAVVTPKMSLGPAAAEEAPQVADGIPEAWKNPEDIWDEPDTEEMSPETTAEVERVKQELEPDPVDPKAAKVATLVQQVYEFLGTHNVDQTWRRLLCKSYHRNLAYGSWPIGFRGEFKQRFEGFLKDSQFVTHCCRKILDTEYGPALGVNHVATFVVSLAGHTSFCLSGIGASL